MATEENLAQQRQLYGEPLADITGRVRNSLNLTQAGLARLLHTSRSAVSLRYMGRVQWRIDELERVAWYLNLPVTDLFKQPRRTSSYF